jgi:hypothetical protein
VIAALSLSALIGTKPRLYLAIATAFVSLYLLWNYVIVPIIEWIFDAGERRQAHDVYHQHADEERRKWNAIVGERRH